MGNSRYAEEEKKRHERSFEERGIRVPLNTFDVVTQLKSRYPMGLGKSIAFSIGNAWQPGNFLLSRLRIGEPQLLSPAMSS